MSYTIHTAETAPEPARELLEQTQKAYGFLPNLLGVMAEAPALLDGRTPNQVYSSYPGLTPGMRLAP